MKKRIAVLVLAGCGIIALPAFAIFGIPSIVWDPTACARLLTQIHQMEKDYTQMVQTYNMVTNQYKQMVTNAKFLPTAFLNHYRALSTPWSMTSATNTYGTTGGWINAVNSGVGVQPGYMAASTPLGDYSSVWGALSAEQQEVVKRNYSTLELADGSAINGLTTVGAIRGNASNVDHAISILENDSLSGDPAQHTEVAVLNKINAANVIALRNTQDTNKLLAGLLEQQIAANKGIRDAQAASINTEIAYRQKAEALTEQHISGSADAIATFVLP